MKSEPIVPSRFSEQLAYSTTIQEKKNNIQEISSSTLKQCRSYEKREISPAEACVWKSKLDEESVWSLTRRIFQNELACPFDCRNNMHAEGAQIELNKWVLKTKLVPIGRHFKSFAAAKFALLTAMCHPDCDFNTLLKDISKLMPIRQPAISPRKSCWVRRFTPSAFWHAHCLIDGRLVQSLSEGLWKRKYMSSWAPRVKSAM